MVKNNFYHFKLLEIFFIFSLIITSVQLVFGYFLNVNCKRSFTKYTARDSLHSNCPQLVLYVYLSLKSNHISTANIISDANKDYKRPI